VRLSKSWSVSSELLSLSSVEDGSIDGTGDSSLALLWTLSTSTSVAVFVVGFSSIRVSFSLVFRSVVSVALFTSHVLVWKNVEVARTSVWVLVDLDLGFRFACVDRSRVMNWNISLKLVSFDVQAIGSNSSDSSDDSILTDAV
jgi:hypothetical protein